MTGFAAGQAYNGEPGGGAVVIYLDQVFFWNTAADLVLLAAVQRLLGLPLCRRRTCLAAVVGGIYGVLAVLPGLDWLARPFPAGAAALLLVWLVFGRVSYLPRYWLLLGVTACAMAGAVAATERLGQLPGRWPVFLAAFLGCWGLLSWVFPGSAGGLREEAEVLQVSMQHRGRKIVFPCLRDTGNSLCDPLTGRPVLVVWRQALLPVLPEVEAKELRPLRYQSLGNPAGSMPCFLAERVEIGGEVFLRQPVAIASSPLSDGMRYTALWNGKGDRNGTEGIKTAAV